MKKIGSLILVGFLTFFIATNVYAEHSLERAYNLFIGDANTLYEVDTSEADISDSLYNSLNNACNESKSLTSGYGMVHIENGNYEIDERNYYLCSNVYIIMEPNTVITKVSGTNDSIFRTTTTTNTTNALIYGGKLNVNGKGKSAIELVGANSVIIKDVELVGGTNSGIRVDASNNIALMDVRVHDNNAYGVFVTNSTVTIDRSGIWNNAPHGIYANNNANVRVDTSEIWNNKESGVSLNNSSEVTITNSDINGNGKSGLYATKTSKLTLRNSNVYSNKEYGIQIIDGSKLYANDNANNRIYSNNYSGVTATGSGTEVLLHKNEITGNGVNPKQTSDGAVGHGVGVSENAYANITNNTITNNKECGISVFNGAKVKIVNNTITNNGRHGIGARKNITLKEITNNNISNNSYNGVLLSDRVSGPLTGNTINENGNFGLSVVDKSTVTLKSNTITYNTSSNVSISKGDAKLAGATVTLAGDNYIAYSKKEHGIAVSGSTSLIIDTKNNKIERNKKNGLSVTGSSTLKISAATTVYGNGDTGIYLKDSNASIKSAKVRKNASHGVFINNSGDLNIWKSTISQNGDYGINISGSKVTGKVSSNTIESNDVGVTVNKGATVSTIKNNTIKSNKSFGIMIRNKSLVKEVNNNKIEKNKEKGIFMNNGKANKIMKNTIGSNGEYGIMLMNGSTALDVYKNTIKKHTKYGVATYDSTIKKLASSNNIYKNTKKNYYVG